jgi:signal transduction histidine kinase
MSTDFDFLAGGGELGALMRAHDWTATPLGPLSNWPDSLKTTLRLLLTTNHPMFIFWGAELLQFYNDAYRRTMGPERHPSALGGRGRECWDEVWPIIGPQIEFVMTGRGATWHESQLVPVTRHGKREDVWWTYSYSPIEDAFGVRGVLVVCNDVTQQVRAEEALRQLAAHLQAVKEEERRRIAREIHDELGQHLLALRIDVSMLPDSTGTPHPELNEKVGSALAKIDDVMCSVNNIIDDLHPGVLDLGLNAAIEWQIKQFERRTGVTCDLISSKEDVMLSDTCTTALFRILQESLTNIRRHAQATQVTIELHETDTYIQMKISDNGVGSSNVTRSQSKTFGLLDIRERVGMLGGIFEITSELNKGTRLAVSVPIKHNMAVQSEW